MDHSPLSHSIAAMVRRESVQAHRELDRGRSSSSSYWTITRPTTWTPG